MMYNYVIFGSDWDLYKTSYSDVFEYDNVLYIESPVVFSKRSFLGFLYRIHFYNYGKGIRIPFKSLWNRFYFKNTFTKKYPICFIFFNPWIRMDVGLPEYLRRKYPDCKLVWMNQDLIKSQSYLYSNKPYEVNLIKKKFDLCMSFDKGDCEKYGFVYHPLVFSNIKFPNELKLENDVYFLARVKERFEEILKIFEYFQSKGLKCDFYLVGVPQEKQLYPDSIHYIDGMDYMTNLQKIRQSRCILEVMQKSGTGFTQRGCEAVCLGKKLLTNNPYINEEPFYNPKYISMFKSVDDIDETFVKQIPEDVIIDYKYKEKMSPIELLQFIEKRI